MCSGLLPGSRSEALGMVVGSRAHLEKEAIAKRHWFRNFLMRGFHLLVLMVAGGAVRDTQCGFKVSSAQCTCKAKNHQNRCLHCILGAATV